MYPRDDDGRAQADRDQADRDHPDAGPVNGYPNSRSDGDTRHDGGAPGRAGAAPGSTAHGDADQTSVRSDRRGQPVNSMYDTTDRAAMDRIGVRERTANSTTYVRRPRPDDVPAAAPTNGVLERVGEDPDPSTRVGGRHSRADEAKQPPVRPGQGRRGPMFWRNRPQWLRRLVMFGLLFCVLMFAALVAVLYSFTKVPLPATVNAAEQTSIITYADRTTEIAKIGTVNRTDVPLSEVSVDVQHAVLAAENKNFYSEPGISPKGIARALWVNVRGGEIAQGGSTITQQYAKNAYLTQERTFSRKMKEIVLAVKLARKYSKEEILESYLNTIYFGRGAYGIEAASKTYFGKSAKDLTAEEGAVIAGLIRSPNGLDPRVTPAAAERRWHEVLDTMVAKGWLDASRLTPDKKPPVTLERDKSNGMALSSPQAAYIRDQVKDELVDAGITEQQINLEGLRIQTSIDQGRQTAAYLAVTNVLAKPYTTVPDLRTGLVAVEPGTGRVLAWYGGSIYGKGDNGQTSYVDNVSGAQVPPGSTFKPITLAAALQEGASLKSVYEAPDVLRIPGKATDGSGTYVVRNDEEHGNFGYIDLIEATAESVNTVYVPLGIEAGIDNVVSTAHALGVAKDVKLTDDAGVTLGRDGITAKSMVAVYGTFANGGKAAVPHLVDRVIDSKGKVIYEGPTTSKNAIPANVAADVTYALQAVLKNGTGKAAQLADGRPAAGKTGTTDNFRTAWFCGYVPQVAACVNMFRGDGGVSKATALTGIPGATGGVYGGGYPAKIWKAFMDGALTGVTPQGFPPPKYGGTVTNASPSPTPQPTISSEPTASPEATDTADVPDRRGRPTARFLPSTVATSSPDGQVGPTATPNPRRSKNDGLPQFEDPAG
ncbi:transglycosylase domain-containing protein [Protofrankia symbiont of Coriaria ruscifolia]|uniref:transglycosylase domain-containing protein n=1 Tax=Protofrankia symbiont of Coriaria ruscifolia TaxID=1306542 RepID=UPI001F5FA440|nr:transglycosylase domain-containing protein [Protofrankia symbiont of Coriaria ruscifolia]